MPMTNLDTTQSSHEEDMTPVVTNPLISNDGIRWIGWTSIALTFGFLLNNGLIVWAGMPGLFAIGSEGGGLAYVHLLLFASCFILPALWVKQRDATLRDDAMRFCGMANFIIRACFWSVVFIGLADAFISFLRVEALLDVVFGEQLASDLGRSRYRGPYVHLPLVAIAFLIASFTKSLGFYWLGFLVVIAELGIVMSRFVFSYEQAFQGDLVRFWYAALFLFASAYTLFEDGHVRVDVLYSTFNRKTRGYVNSFGSVFLGMSLCWCVLAIGLWDQTAIINAPLLNFEVSQSGFGMYIKYWMAAFLAVFAVSMNVQFTSYFMESIADVRGEPGAREIAPTMH